MARSVPPSRDTAIIAPDLLLEAYAGGMFPMAMENGEMGWFSPDPRGIIPIKEFHIPHGLKKVLRNNPFDVRFDTAFGAVMKGCADRESTWISDMIHRSYVKLHELGFAHSVEIWQDNALVGGLYGLVNRLDERGFVLLDTQWVTEHLTQFGAHEIPRSTYLKRLNKALNLHCSFS